MSYPDHSDSRHRANYRRELRGIAVPQRIVGLSLTFLALVFFLWPQIFGTATLWGLPTRLIGWSMLAMGWVLLIWAILIRTRYHKRRMTKD